MQKLIQPQLGETNAQSQLLLDNARNFKRRSTTPNLRTGKPDIELKIGENMQNQMKLFKF